jgi:hypothetical protein
VEEGKGVALAHKEGGGGRTRAQRRRVERRAVGENRGGPVSWPLWAGWLWARPAMHSTFGFIQYFQVNPNLPWFKIYLPLLKKFQINYGFVGI